MTQNTAQNKKSIKELLGPEYNTIFSVNVSQSVNMLLDRFAPENSETQFFRETIGDLYLGEMPAVLNDYAFRDVGSLWQKPIATDALPDNIRFALHKDKALSQIMSNVFPNQPFDAETPTLAALVNISNIYYAGITVRLARYKQQDFIDRMNIICDPAQYVVNRNILLASPHESLRAFAHCAPETPRPLIITAKKENVVKGIERVLEKALEYDPLQNPKPDHMNGVFAVRDIHRTSISLENPKNMTMSDWVNARNQIGVNTLSGALGMDLKKVKDVVTESKGNTHIFPRCLFTGSNYFMIDDQFYVGFSSELQFNPCSDEFGRHVREITTDLYTKSRSKKNNNHNQKELFSLMRAETLGHYLSTHFPQMAATMCDPNHHDHSYDMLQCAIKDKPRPVRDPNSIYVNLSKTNFLDHIIQDANGRRVMQSIIRPMPQQRMTI